MFPIEHDYTVTLSDLRKATYFSMIRRSNKAFLILFLVLAFALIYGIAALTGFGKANPFVFFIAGAYAVWGLIMCVGAEKRIRSLISDPSSALGMRFHAVFTKESIEFNIPEQNVHVSFRLKKMLCIFELHALYLFYINSQQVYIVPKRGMSEESFIQLRSLYRTLLRDRFWTRFEKK